MPGTLQPVPMAKVGLCPKTGLTSVDKCYITHAVVYCLPVKYWVNKIMYQTGTNEGQQSIVFQLGEPLRVPVKGVSNTCESQVQGRGQIPLLINPQRVERKKRGYVDEEEGV